MNTLPSWLSFQATERHIDVAIRHKRLGIWQEKQWGELYREVLRLVHLLGEKGFTQGDTLFLLTNPRPEALLVSIAAHWLGGISAPLDPHCDDVKILGLLRELQPVFVFAEGQMQIDLLLKINTKQRLVVYADARGLSRYDHEILRNYSDLKSNPLDGLNAPSSAKPSHDAFVFYRLDENDQVEVQKLTHSEMLSHGRQLINQETLTNKEEALAARNFAASGHMRYLLAPWLLAGFKLNFPENSDTRDIDRRELGPTLVAGTSQTYQRLENLVTSRLPLVGTARRTFVNWSLTTDINSSPVRKAIAYWLVIRPLRDVMGFSRTRVPLLVGEALPEDSLKFFASIGIQVRDWSDKVTEQNILAASPNQNSRHAALTETARVTE